MNSMIYILTITALAVAHPISDADNVAQEDISPLSDQLTNAAYRKNFQNMLIEYVLTEYKDLTFAERQKVGVIVEDLLRDVAQDFRMVLVDNDTKDESVATRIRGPAFDEVHRFIVSSMPGIDAYKALILAYRLMDDLVNARQKIENVIRASKIAYINNSES